MIIYITGGERSGKSRFAQELALSLSDNPAYMATARIWDEEFAARIQKHKDDRDERWTNVEEEKYLSKALPQNKVVVIDCVTLWLTNFFSDFEYNVHKSIDAAQQEINLLKTCDKTIILISNEIGMGLHANSSSGRAFVDLQGRVNQYLGQAATEAYFMVSGLPLKLK